MTVGAKFFRWHRWLGWVVALQVLAWVLGGLVFSWLPFNAWVKAEAWVRKPSQVLPPDWAASVARHFQQHPVGPLTAISSVATASGPALRLRHATGETWIRMNGSALPPPDAAAVEHFARSLYIGPATRADVTRLAEVPPRALIVREVASRTDVWRVAFHDSLGTRLYFDARSGELLSIRNDAWVLYDFFWRLHLMDYRAGEDFNHPLIKGATFVAFAFVVTGLVLAALAVRRVWRHRARGARKA